MAKSKKAEDNILREKHLIEWMRNDLYAGFNEVVEVYQKHLLLVADGVIGDTPRLIHLKEDIVQDSLLKAFQHLATHPEMLDEQEPGNHFQLRAWLTKITQRQAIACRKTAEAHFTITSGLLGEEIEGAIEEGYITHYDDPVLFFDRLESIREAKRTTQQLLSSLPYEQRVAVEYMYLKTPNHDEKKITYEQAAKDLEKPAGTIKSQVSRAMKQMREQLTELPDERRNQQRKLS